MEQDFWAFVRENIIGCNAVIRTPFGARRVTYADYTASGRGVAFIERYMQKVLELYGNTHTEDDATGIITTERLHQAEKTIKRLLNAGAQYRIIEDGAGATGAVHRLQQILGVYIPPVAGVITPVYEVARILHCHGALAFFDFAAIAPYGEIDMCRDEESYFDGIYFSPHKFLGGPGSSGILIIHERVYRKDLAPTVGAGGTVDYVSFDEQQYNPEIEVREKPGTPGILQIMRAALALELKQQLGPKRIAEREKELIRRALEKFKDRLMHGFRGVKPGWVRVNFHFLMTDEEFEFILDAICFVCRYGKYFLPLYEFDIHMGSWRYRGYSSPEVTFGLDKALRAGMGTGEGEREERCHKELYSLYMQKALKSAEEFKEDFDERAIQTTEKDLIPFVYV